MQIKTILAVTSTAILLALGCSRSADEKYAQAESAFARGAYEQALTLCRSLQEEYPTYTKAYLLAARIMESQDDPAGAVLTCRRGLENGADSVALGLVLARIYRQAGELERAYGYYRQVLRKAPRNTVALKAAGEILRSKGLYSAAAATYRRLLQAGDKSKSARLALAEILQAMGQDSNAVAVLKQIMASNPLTAKAYSLLAVSWARLGESADSVRTYHQRAIQLAPQDSSVLKNYLRFLQDQGPVNEYLKQLQKYTALFPDDPWGRRRLAGLYQALGAESPTWLNAALKEYRRLIDLDPLDASSQAHMAEIYLRQGKSNLARLRAKLAFEIAPSPRYQALLDSVMRYEP